MTGTRMRPAIVVGLFLGLLAVALPGVQSEEELEQVPSEDLCRPYIEKALKDLGTGSLEQTSVEVKTEVDQESHEKASPTSEDAGEGVDNVSKEEDDATNEEKSIEESVEVDESKETTKELIDASEEKTEDESRRQEDEQSEEVTIAKSTESTLREGEMVDASDEATKSDREDIESSEKKIESEEGSEQVKIEEESEEPDEEKSDEETKVEDEKSEEDKIDNEQKSEEENYETKEKKEDSKADDEEKEESREATEEIEVESEERTEEVEQVSVEASMQEEIDKETEETKEATESIEDQKISDEDETTDNEEETQIESIETEDKEKKESEEDTEDVGSEDVEDEAQSEKETGIKSAESQEEKSIEKEIESVEETTSVEEDVKSVEEEAKSVEEEAKSVEEETTSLEEETKSVEEVNLSEDVKSVEDKENEKSEEVEVKCEKSSAECEASIENEKSEVKSEEKNTEKSEDEKEVKSEEENEDIKSRGRREISEETVEAIDDSPEEAASEEQERTPEEDLIQEIEIPENLRPRDHINQLLKLDEENEKKERAIQRSADIILRDLKRLYDNAIHPLESMYKYRDLSNRHFGDPEIFSKPLVLFMGPWSGGKSSIINYLLDIEYKPMSLRTGGLKECLEEHCKSLNGNDAGAEPSPAYFNIIMHGEEEEILDGTQLAADWTFSGLQKFGQGMLDRLRGLRLNNTLLEKVNIVEIPGILEIRKQVQRLFPFNDACQWFIDRADIIFLVYDPAKLDVGPETEAILDQLKGREYQTRIILNKADQVKPEELMRVQGALIWNISPLMSSAEPPIMYSTSLWSLPYEAGAPTRLLYAQERAFLRDLRSAIDKRVEHKIASARRFAVRVRNHAKMVDCYLTTYYNHKTFFGNKKEISDKIIENPQDYHIYEGLSTLTNISRYDLPDPDVYRDFFRLNSLYDFQLLSSTCTYFRGCPINRLDVAIAYDLPELVGKYKKSVEAVLHESEGNTPMS